MAYLSGTSGTTIVPQAICAPLDVHPSQSLFMDIIWFLLVGLVAGWLAGQFVKGGGFGLLGDLVVGVIGAVLGAFVFGLLGISAGGLIGSLVCATVGAVLLLVILRMIKRGP
jgi:uncharacterized membrane protein YeaQ/YmgE (transglycosylase-associated protein family)